MGIALRLLHGSPMTGRDWLREVRCKRPPVSQVNRLEACREWMIYKCLLGYRQVSTTASRDLLFVCSGLVDTAVENYFPLLPFTFTPYTSSNRGCKYVFPNSYKENENCKGKVAEKVYRDNNRVGIYTLYRPPATRAV